MIQKIGTKSPTMNMTQWPLRRLITPSVMSSTSQRIPSSRPSVDPAI